MHLAKITFYSRPGSPECARARVWLLDRRYIFRERAVDADGEAHAAWINASPGGVVPAFDIDGQTFAGFDADRLQGALEYAGARRLQR
jgi:glutathione S-transferase